MNDRYLFRAKRMDNGEWVEGYYLFCPIKDVNKSDIENLISHHWIVEHDGFTYKVDPLTVCQCTGLKDKNGKLIWENDILMCHGNRNDLVKAVFGEFYVINTETLEKIDKVIGWHYEILPTDALSRCEPFCLSMPLTGEYVKTCEFEVIGNIFDNQELLKEGGNYDYD